MAQGDENPPTIQKPDVEAFPLAASLLSLEPWADTGEILGGASLGRRVKSPAGRSGIRKPGDPVANSEEAFREILAVQIARWLDLAVPAGELFTTNGRPCFVSLDLGPTALKWGTVMSDPVGLPHRAAATIALQSHVGILALDALLGVEDRQNPGNHLYVPSENRWYGIDYSYSFNTSSTSGVGSAEGFKTAYYAEMIEAVRLAPKNLEAAIRAVMAIPNDRFEALCRLPDALYASQETREKAFAFLVTRRAKLRQILQEWCKLMNLDGILNDAQS